MKTITGLLILIGLINCASKPTEMRSDICTEKYFSNKWKVTVYHSKDWSPYEFYGNNIGLEYKGLQNFERRYEAEVVITLINDNSISNEDSFYKTLINSLENKKEQATKLFGTEIKTNITDKRHTEFANKKWKTFEMDIAASVKGDTFNSRETNYLWYSNDIKIRIVTSIRGKEIEGLSPEIDCILNGLVFN
jgi:hypothetical protein